NALLTPTNAAATASATPAGRKPATAGLGAGTTQLCPGVRARTRASGLEAQLMRSPVVAHRSTTYKPLQARSRAADQGAAAAAETSAFQYGGKVSYGFGSLSLVTNSAPAPLADAPATSLFITLLPAPYTMCA